MGFFAGGGWNEKGLSDHDAGGIGDLVGVDDVLRPGAVLLGDEGKRVALLHGVADSFLGVIVAEGGLDNGARGQALGHRIQGGVGSVTEFLDLRGCALRRGGVAGLDGLVELGRGGVQLLDRGIGLGGSCGFLAQLAILPLELLDAEGKLADALDQPADILAQIGQLHLGGLRQHPSGKNEEQAAGENGAE